MATSEPVVHHHGREGDRDSRDEARPSASTACWAAGERRSELAVERSIGLVVDLVRGCQPGVQREGCSDGSRGRRCEPWMARSGGPHALEVQPVLGRRSSPGRAEQRGESVARSDEAETSSAAEPVVFDHGREDGVEQSPRPSRLRAGRWKCRRLALETSGGKRSEAKGLRDVDALLVPGQSDRTVRQ